MARVVLPSPEALELAATVLRTGGLVGIPTETVYGLAARALDPGAVAKIYAAKDRPSFNPLICHVGLASRSLDALVDQHLVDRSRLTRYAQNLVQTLMTSAWPGPLTLVLPRGPAIPDLPTAGLDTVGLRCPDHPVALALLNFDLGPLAAPSANRSGRVSPTSAADVAADLGDRVEWVLDGGPCRIGLESTVAWVGEQGDVTLLRPGAISRSTLESWIGAPVSNSTDHESSPRSPGMTAAHYAPAAPLVPLGRTWTPADGKDGPLLCWTEADRSRAAARGHPAPTALTVDGDSAEAARRLFGVLRALDEPGPPYILIEPCPPGEPTDGLDVAIADRLRRAGGRAG
jgi:L-threonylcarbamoyladenylate synthase